MRIPTCCRATARLDHGRDEGSIRRDTRLLSNFVNIIAAGGMDSAKGLALIAKAYPRVNFEDLAALIAEQQVKHRKTLAGLDGMAVQSRGKTRRLAP